MCPMSRIQQIANIALKFISPYDKLVQDYADLS
jgi:hypothetical protein